MATNELQTAHKTVKTSLRNILLAEINQVKSRVRNKSNVSMELISHEDLKKQERSKYFRVHVCWCDLNRDIRCWKRCLCLQQQTHFSNVKKTKMSQTARGNSSEVEIKHSCNQSSLH
ncbi:hypothetical protein L596_017327 [Steinernema carpocapsae]|uniref:Uncharacterized protein n=1 Tax=Steinernema carpocapsae TaxID=34508 RepID=A0A4U5N1K2_STECR|nr:hypothetical protein L596_017327 [Steinernema carpocapsae]